LSQGEGVVPQVRKAFSAVEVGATSFERAVQSLTVSARWDHWCRSEASEASGGTT
jgi:hypothetical protein